jgi:hypothetical protein
VDREQWTAPHDDLDLWMLQLADAFGIRSQAVISTLLGQLETVVMTMRSTPLSAPLDPVLAMAESDPVDGGRHLAQITSRAD